MLKMSKKYLKFLARQKPIFISGVYYKGNKIPVMAFEDSKECLKFSKSYKLGKPYNESIILLRKKDKK